MRSIPTRLAVLGVAGALCAAAPAQAQELRIGFITTLTGGGAFLGNQQQQGFMLGLEDEGWKKDGDKLGGVPTRLFTGDDKQQPQIGLEVARKFIQSDNVHIISGIVWSNVMMAVQRSVFRAKRIIVGTNAGPSPLAGGRCSPYFVSTSWNNDQQGESSGALVQQDGAKNVFLVSANYQAGKDMLAGFEQGYKGKIVGRILYKLGATDFQAEITRIRAAKPDAVFVFAPGAMGIAFTKQWEAAGLGKTIKLYTLAVVDNVTLKAIGKSAIGSMHAIFWNHEGDFPGNKKFVKGYIAKHGRMPSYFAAQAYDAPRLIAAAVRKVGGKIDMKNLLPLAKAMRKVEFESVRGPFKYNVNGFPIQDWYKREVVLDKNGVPVIKATAKVFEAHLDAYWEKCPKAKRH